MFVTSILSDWKRKLDEGRRRHNNGRYDYEEFLANQKRIWTPPELFEKCCPRWLAGGNLCSLDDHHHHIHHHHHTHPSQYDSNGSAGNGPSFDDWRREDSAFVRLKNGSWTCPGGCNKAHPTITLFFEGGVRDIGADPDNASSACKTIAILSSRLDPFTAYFDGRVADGSAACKTPFYYELDGFLRDNLHRLRQQPLFGGHLVKVAMGAMDESDGVHRQVLENEDRSSRLLRRPPHAYGRLEEVLEICRLHRLGDDLDVLSIYCMQRTSRSFRRVADPMARERMRACRLVVSPLVDGHYVAGYSAFRRVNPDLPTVLEREHGRLVEYAVGPEIVLEQDGTEPGKFVPAHGGGGSGATNGGPAPSRDSFCWACEELSFANLQREWGDIGMHEYVGQRVVVRWRRGVVDVVADGTQQQDLPPPPTDLTVHDAGITFRAVRDGSFAVTHSSALFSFGVLVERMDAVQVDDVTVSFRGRARVSSCRVDFRFLVAEYARSLEPCLAAAHRRTERTRPLLRRELAFLAEVRDAMLLGGSRPASASGQDRAGMGCID